MPRNTTSNRQEEAIGDPGLGLDDEAGPVEANESNPAASAVETPDSPEAEEPKKYVRISDEARPHCPRCSDDVTSVVKFLASVHTDGPITYYKCDECNFSKKVMRKTARQLLQSRQNPLASGELSSR